MKKMKKLGVFMATVAAAGAIALAGCNGAEAPAGSSAAAEDESGYTLVSEGTLTVGTSAEYEPFEYMEDGEFKGFDLDLIKKIGEKLGLEVEIENVDFDSIVAGVSSGAKYDCGIAAITVTPKREKEVDFTDSYYMDDQAIVTTKDNASVTGDNYTDALNSADVKIAVQSGSTAESFAKENFPEAELVPFKNATDCFAALQAGQASALVTNRSVAAQMVSSAYDNCHIVKQIPTGEDYAIAVGKENQQLLEDINAALVELTENGTVDALMEQYNIK